MDPESDVNRLELLRCLCIVLWPLIGLFWLIFTVGAVFPLEVLRDGWYMWVVGLCDHCRSLMMNGRKRG